MHIINIILRTAEEGLGLIKCNRDLLLEADEDAPMPVVFYVEGAISNQELKLMAVNLFLKQFNRLQINHLSTKEELSKQSMYYLEEIKKELGL